METLTLVDGTILDGHVLPSSDMDRIFVYLTGKTLAEGYAVFSDAVNIAVITEMNHGTEHVYEGYTEITAINNEYGNCNLTLKRVNNIG